MTGRPLACASAWLCTCAFDDAGATLFFTLVLFSLLSLSFGPKLEEEASAAAAVDDATLNELALVHQSTLDAMLAVIDGAAVGGFDSQAPRLESECLTAVDPESAQEQHRDQRPVGVASRTDVVACGQPVLDHQQESGDEGDAAEVALEKPMRLHDIRLDSVTAELKRLGARRVLDLGCGEGRLMARLIKERGIDRIVGVDPSERGSGIGHALTVLGLVHLRALGLGEVMLYVDESNTAAIALYESLGFIHWDTDVMYART